MVVSRQYFFERVFAGPLDGTSYIQLLSGCKTKYAPSILEFETLVMCYDNHDVYFSVCPKKAANGFKDQVKYAGCAWADLDAKTIGSKQEAYDRVWNGNFARPTFLVDSGNGYHGYWCFIKPVYDLEGVEQINNHIARTIGADHCFNINRLLRVPGTMNYKDPSRPKPCQIVHYSGFVYDYDFFPKQEIVRKETAKASINPNIDFNIRTLPFPLPLRILEGYENCSVCRKPDGAVDRSRTDFKVACKLVEAGLSDDEIGSVFLNNEHGISGKTYSHPTEYLRFRYLNRMIGSARAAVEDNDGR